MTQIHIKHRELLLLLLLCCCHRKMHFWRKQNSDKCICDGAANIRSLNQPSVSTPPPVSTFLWHSPQLQIRPALSYETHQTKNKFNKYCSDYRCQLLNVPTRVCNKPAFSAISSSPTWKKQNKKKNVNMTGCSEMWACTKFASWMKWGWM